ncbi:ATP-binding protein [Streptomyces sp. NPDC001286]
MNPRPSADASGVVWAVLPALRTTLPVAPLPASALPRFEQHLSASWTLSGRSLHTPRATRRHVTGTCRTWHVPRQTTEGLALITSELATNAVVHAHAEEITVRLGLAPQYVWVSVTDHGRPRSPIVRRSPAADAEDGRGLCLVEALATRWQATTSLSGTRVWACIALPHCGTPPNLTAVASPVSDQAHPAEASGADDPLTHPVAQTITPPPRTPRCPNR